MYTIGHILFGTAAVVLIGSAVMTEIWKQQKIIVASSVKMMHCIFLGALVMLSSNLFLEPDNLFHGYLRVFLLQIGAILMFAALEGMFLTAAISIKTHASFLFFNLM